MRLLLIIIGIMSRNVWQALSLSALDLSSSVCACVYMSTMILISRLNFELTHIHKHTRS